tara:strand:- start:3116 stop:4573 length:1458 start_codon:yes stop_codon:yes gene_type:complete
MAYIGKPGAVSKPYTSKTLATMVGDGSTTTLTLNSTPDSVNDVAVYLDGIFQRPTNEYTLSGNVITFTTAPENSVFVCALVGGGEHIGSPMANSISTEKLIDGTVTNANIDSVSTSKISGTLPALNANAVTNLNAANLTGSALPALDGSNLTGISTFTKNANDPAIDTNPSGGVGTIWANTTSGELFVCTDATAGANVWANVGEGTGDVSPFTGMVATGGTITTDGDYKIHTFTDSGDFNITTLGSLGTLEYLVIAGGGSGGGGNDTGGGGGAGGYRTATNFAVTAQNYTVTIGAGGAGSTTSSNFRGNNGSDSTFSTITSTGGGGGGTNESSPAGGQDGGSGSGAGHYHGSYTHASAGGSGIAGQGNDGGSNSTSSSVYRACGGGGAGAVGSDGNTGNGGDGLSSSITGSAVVRAGGGAGSGWYVNGGTGGSGGGGSTSGNYQGTGGPGSVNTGGGGAGGNGAGGGGGAGSGGSGVVIIRYKYQ